MIKASSFGTIFQIVQSEYILVQMSKRLVIKYIIPLIIFVTQGSVDQQWSTLHSDFLKSKKLIFFGAKFINFIADAVNSHPQETWSWNMNFHLGVITGRKQQPIKQRSRCFLTVPGSFLR